MSDQAWLSAPVGIDAQRWLTRSGCRSVLVAVHTITTGHRLLDVVDHVESDRRVQVVFTVAPDVFNQTVPEYLQQLGALVLPWEQAVRERFDLALAAAHGGLSALHAPLMVMAHGAGHAKSTLPPQSGGPVLATPPVYGLDAARLIRDGRVLASALLLAHNSELEVLRRQCPEALPTAVVIGDPCYDRLMASLPARDRYRRALGVRADQELIVVCSTWGRDGLFGRAPDLLHRLMNQLPSSRYRIGALLHPAVWAAHGTRQVRAWMRDCCAAGLILLSPMEDWRTMVIAADRVIGDHGSVTAYAAALGQPVLCLDAVPSTVVAAATAQRLVRSQAARLDPARALPPQLRTARPLDLAAIRAALTSRPGRSAALIRREIYRLLRLSEPAQPRPPSWVPAPAAYQGGAAQCRAA